MAKRWYVVHVYSGFEKKIAEQVKEQAARKGLADLLGDILVPAEEVVELKRGQKVQAERKFFPGYVLVNMELTDDTWHLIKDTPKVTGFLGNNKLKPQAIRRPRPNASSSSPPKASTVPARPCCSRSASRFAWPTARSPRSTAPSRRSTRRRAG